MGTTADKLNHLLETKDEIKAALISKGQNVPDNLPFSEYADKIRAISGSEGITLGQLPEGSIIRLNENGVPVDFYVAKHDYEPELNGEGRTLCARREAFGASQWNASNVNTYADSTIDTTMNTHFKSLLDVDIQEKIGITNFRYSIGNGETTMGVLGRSVFLLSLSELGYSDITYSNKEGEPLGFNDLKSLYFDGNLVEQWTRSPKTGGSNKTSYAFFVNTSTYDGNFKISSTGVTLEHYYRPCFTLPSSYIVY